MRLTPPLPGVVSASAAKIAGLETVPVIVREATDQELLELALIENVQRADLNPVETAVAVEDVQANLGGAVANHAELFRGGAADQDDATLGK